MWYWLDKSTNEWKKVPETVEWDDISDSDALEKEYRSELNGTRMGQRVYHCFGKRCFAGVDFKTMTTYCSSAKCYFMHEKNGYADDHLTFKLRRFEEKDVKVGPSVSSSFII